MNPLKILREIRDCFLEITLPPRVSLPPLKTAAKPERPAKKRRETAKVHVIAGRRFQERDGENGTVEWVNISGKTESVAGRDANLTDADFDEIERAGLDDEKAAMLKPLWAQGLTATQIRKELNGDAETYGLGQRTIEAYTATFSRAHSLESR